MTVRTGGGRVKKNRHPTSRIIPKPSGTRTRRRNFMPGRLADRFGAVRPFLGVAQPTPRCARLPDAPADGIESYRALTPFGKFRGGRDSRYRQDMVHFRGLSA